MENSELKQDGDDQLNVSRPNEQGSVSSFESCEEKALRNELILERILLYLDLDGLKIMRQVSNLFNKLGIKEMFRKFYLNLHQRTLRQEDHQFQAFFAKYSHCVKFRNVKISSCNHDLQSHSWGNGLLPRVHLYGHHIRELIYDTGSCYNAQILEFCCKLTKLPNLKVLELSYLSLEPPSASAWTLIYQLLGRLEKVTIHRMSPTALKNFFKLSSNAPKCIQNILPGLGNWSPEVGGGHVPRGSLIGGRDNEIGQNLIVARAHHPRGDLLAGKLVAARGICYAPWAGAAHELRRYETLILKEDEVEWVPANDDQVVPGAVVGGMTDYGEILYVGRALHEGSVHLGKIHRSHRVLYIAYAGQEIAHSSYETLVLKSAVSN